MELVTFPLTLLLLMYFLAWCHHYLPSYLTQETESFPTFFPLQNNQNQYIPLSFHFIVFSPSPMDSPSPKPSWLLLRLPQSPIRLFCLAPLQLVHTTTARGIFLLTPVFKALWWPILIGLTIQSVLLHSANSNPSNVRFCFPPHPHSGCALQVFDFPPGSLASLFYPSEMWLCLRFPFCQGVPLPPSSVLWTLPSCFSQKFIFKILSFSTFPSKNVHSALQSHSALWLLQ